MKISNTSKRLKQIMEAMNLKQVDILNKAKPICEEYDIKLSKTDLSQYVSGKVEPGAEKLTVLAKALDVQETWLMGYDVDMKNHNDYANVIAWCKDEITKEQPLIEIADMLGWKFTYEADQDDNALSEGCDDFIRNERYEFTNGDITFYVSVPDFNNLVEKTIYYVGDNIQELLRKSIKESFADNSKRIVSLKPKTNDLLDNHVVAAHNDNEDPEQLEKMQRDAARLKEEAARRRAKRNE